MTFARCEVVLELARPADGMIGIELFRGALLRPDGEGWPWFCIRSDIRIGLGATVITDAECVEPGAHGNIPGGVLVEVAGYPRDALLVVNRPAIGGRGRPDAILDPQPEPGFSLARTRGPDRERECELADMAALVRMNLATLENKLTRSMDLVWTAADRRSIERVLVHGDVYSTVARILLGKDGVPAVAMGFHQTKLVYLSTGEKPVVNLLPGGGHLFLPSEGIKLLGS